MSCAGGRGRRKYCPKGLRRGNACSVPACDRPVSSFHRFSRALSRTRRDGAFPSRTSSCSKSRSHEITTKSLFVTGDEEQAGIKPFLDIVERISHASNDDSSSDRLHLAFPSSGDTYKPSNGKIAVASEIQPLATTEALFGVHQGWVAISPLGNSIEVKQRLGALPTESCGNRAMKATRATRSDC